MKYMYYHDSDTRGEARTPRDKSLGTNLTRKSTESESHQNINSFLHRTNPVSIPTLDHSFSIGIDVIMSKMSHQRENNHWKLPWRNDYVYDKINETSTKQLAI